MVHLRSILIPFSQPDNHIIALSPSDSAMNSLPQPPSASSTSSIPVIPVTANLPFIVDVRDDPRTSSPTTDGFL